MRCKLKFASISVEASRTVALALLSAVFNIGSPGKLGRPFKREATRSEA